MAAETTEPKSVLILQIGLASVVFLIVARFALFSYFNVQMDGEYQAKIGSHKSDQLVKLHQEEQAALSGGAMPIDKAIAMMATKSRETMGDGMTPKPSSDLAAVVGWGQAPHELPPGAASAEPAVVAVDGGTVATSDGGATTLGTGDAGAAVAAHRTDGGAPADAGRPQSPAPVPAPTVAPKDKP